MIAEARGLGMDALVEVHDEPQMRRALGLGAPMIGINNRDLRDLSINLATTERLAPLAPGRLLVSESGLSARADVERLNPFVDGFLIGSALMRADEPAQARVRCSSGGSSCAGSTAPRMSKPVQRPASPVSYSCPKPPASLRSRRPCRLPRRPGRSG